MTKVITFGCRLNFYESGIIQEALKKANRQDVIVIHSCAVTNEAEKKVKQAIRKSHREHPEKKIIVAGCAAQLNPEEYLNMAGVSQVLGNKEKLLHKNYLLEKDSVSSITPTQDEPTVPNFQDRSRAFVQVQNGCNHDCTFCAITHARGRNRSIPIGHIVYQTQELIKNGHQEIVLTGVDITDFGQDLPGKPSLGSMVRRLLNLTPELTRLRLSSIDVAEIDDELFNLIINEQRLVPHIHISAQSGDNMILKRMKRRHNRDQIISFCHKVKKHRPEVTFGADIIAGFPTETDKMFDNTCSMIQEANIVYLHVFPYSAKTGTAAARMPQVSMELRKQRAKILRDINKISLINFYQSQINTEHEVIIEKNNYGRSRNFAVVKLDTTDIMGDIVNVKIIGNQEDKFLLGKVLYKC